MDWLISVLLLDPVETELLGDPVSEAEAVVQIEALLSLGGIEKPVVGADASRSGVSKPRVVETRDAPVLDEAEVVGCIGVDGLGPAGSNPPD